MFSLIFSRKGFFESWVKLGMLLFIAAFFLSPDNDVHKYIYYFLIVFPTLLAGFFFKDMFRALQREHIVALCMLVALAIPVLWTPALSTNAVVRLIRNVFYLAALLVTVNYLFVAYPRFVERVAQVLICAGLVTGVGLLARLFLTAENLSEATLLPEWHFDNQIKMANSFGVLIFLSLPLILKPDHKPMAVVAAVTVLVSVAVILFSRSKGATYALLLCLPVFLLVATRLKFKMPRWPWLVGIFLFIGAGIAKLGVVAEFTNDGWSKRDVIWMAVIRSAADHPLLGTGYLVYPRIYGTDGVLYWHEHGLLFSVLRQTGIFGLSIVVGGLGLLIYRAWKIRDGLVGVWLVVLVYGLLAGLSNDRYPLQAPDEMWLWLWLPIAILLAQISRPALNQHLPATCVDSRYAS